MWKSDDKIKCIRCGEEIEPGLMNQAYHWTECPKNPNLKKTLLKNYEQSIKKHSILIERHEEELRLLKLVHTMLKNTKDSNEFILNRIVTVQVSDTTEAK